jgi:hypothetical protein
MSLRADDTWSADEVGLICSRQNGKNGALEVRELYGLAVLNERIIHTAHQFKTTKESYDRLLSLIEANRDVKDCLVDRHASPAVGYDMKFRGGGRIIFIARSRASGRGFSGIDMLVMDEFQDLNDDAQGALLPTISARPNTQTWYMGSAPGPASIVAHRIRARGRKGGEARFAYSEYSADPMADPNSHEAWAQANPALGIRISLDTVEKERRSMSDEMFLRERLSVSPDLEGDDAAFDAAAWAACQQPDLEVKPVWFAADANPERTNGGIVAASPAGLEVVAYAHSMDELERRVVNNCRAHKKPVVVDSRGPAASLVPGWRRQNVRVVEMSTDEMVKAAGELYDAVAAKELRVRPDVDLDRAVRAAQKRPVGDSFCWGRKTSEADISLLVAATCAYWQQQHGKSGELFFSYG